MRKTGLFGVAMIAMLMVAGCNGNKAGRGGDTDSLETTAVDNSDSTVYGVCGEATAMHTLQLIKADGDTVSYMMGLDKEPDVAGGLMVGDQLAVLGGVNADGDNIARTVINITTLLGKWTSIDKNFEIQEGGAVASFVKAETNPYTSWKIYNGKLLLNNDTFRIDVLGPDSLLLENTKGIFAYKRQK